MTAAEQGVDVMDGAALQRFAERARPGEVADDQQVLGAITERRLTGRAQFSGVRAEPQLPVTLPPEASCADGPRSRRSWRSCAGSPSGRDASGGR
ncbi:hypothetical protein GCM10010306_060720 [Streptomyces umbrinus]|uniref:hypothetical protein n=1 Tax=Streptomyces umbrinus TaxID=67370 RepID=UPI001674EFBF|nr:hypothetical protein [Streptomyces umbrinus]GHB59073.1 hypothetical protein GCM10010306_060720 [Streptomyces umbrinus]